MYNDNNLVINRSRLCQILFGLSGRQLARFRELFPTPILDEQVETALSMASGYPKTDLDPKPKSATVVTLLTTPNPKRRIAKKKMQHQ
jgi:hypothetical protein